MSRLIHLPTSIFTILFLLLGCSYKAGSPTSEYSSLHLRVKNDSLAPLLGAKVDRELRKNLIRNGAFVLVNNQEEADAFLLITLTNYEDVTEAYNPEDTLLAAGLNLRAVAKIELLGITGQNVYEDRVKSDASVLRRESIQVPDDAMALQALAEDLAANISLSLLNQAW